MLFLNETIYYKQNLQTMAILLKINNVSNIDNNWLYKFQNFVNYQNVKL